jgi:putative N6-adenine-specific DNA methylase
LKPWDIFISVQPGLEELAKAECEELGLKITSTQTGGLNCTNHPRKLYQIIPYLRIPTKVLVRCGSFYAKHFAQFEKEFNKLDFSAFLSEHPVQAKVECHHCALYHKGAIEERIIKFLNNQRKINSELPTQTIYCRGKDNHFTFSLDASGELLHKRGLLTKRGEAPLRETLAAAMVRAIQPQSHIWDPFCGSGTLLLESYLYHCPTTVSPYRTFAFQSWPNFSKDLKAAEQLELNQQSGFHYYGSDIQQDTLDLAASNAKNLDGFDLELQQKDFHQAHPKEFGDGPLCILTNPPYGERLPFQKLHQQLKKWKSECPNCRILALLPASKSLPNTKTHFKVKNGGLPVVAQELKPS